MAIPKISAPNAANGMMMKIFVLKLMMDI